jgi:hypothetical protein
MAKKSANTEVEAESKILGRDAEAAEEALMEAHQSLETQKIKANKGKKSKEAVES